MNKVPIRTVEYWKGVTDQLPSLDEWRKMKEQNELRKVVEYVTKRLKAVLKVWVSVRELTDATRWEKLPNGKLGFKIVFLAKQDDIKSIDAKCLSKELEGSGIAIHSAMDHYRMLWNKYTDLRISNFVFPKNLKEMFSDYFIQVMVEIRIELLPYLEDDPEYDSERKHPLTVEDALSLVEKFRNNMRILFASEPQNPRGKNIVVSKTPSPKKRRMKPLIDSKKPRKIPKAFAEKNLTSALVRNLPENKEAFLKQLRAMEPFQRAAAVECFEHLLLHYLTVLPKWSKEGQSSAVHRDWEKKSPFSLSGHIAEELKSWIAAFPDPEVLEKEWLPSGINPADTSAESACESLREEIIQWLALIRAVKKELAPKNGGTPWIMQKKRKPTQPKMPARNGKKPIPDRVRQLRDFAQQQDRDSRALENLETDLRRLQSELEQNRKLQMERSKKLIARPPNAGGDYREIINVAAVIRILQGLGKIEQRLMAEIRTLLNRKCQLETSTTNRLAQILAIKK